MLYLFQRAFKDLSVSFWYQNISPGFTSSSAVGEVLQDERDGGRSWCDSVVRETAGWKIKEKSFIIYLLPARHHATWQTFEDWRLWWKWNFTFWCLVSCVRPLRPVTTPPSRDAREWLRLSGRFDDRRSGKERGQNERAERAMIGRWLIAFVCFTAKSPALIKIRNQ